MKNDLLWKTLSIGVLCLLLLIPIAMVRGLVQERQARALEVERQIAEYAAYPQTVTGPFLVLPFRRLEWSQVERRVGDVATMEWVSTETRSAIVLQPERLATDSSMRTETLERGIYKSELYNADVHFKGEFRIPARSKVEDAALPDKRVEYFWEDPTLVLSVNDARGIRQLDGSLGGSALAFLPGTSVSWLSQGLHAVAGPAPDNLEQKVPFGLHLQLTGTSELAITPVGKSNSVVISGNWPHPSFAGRFAPTRREVSGQGFSVEWETTYWATGINEQSLSRCVSAASECSLFSTEQLGLRLVNPVDQYLLTERTLKYANLFLIVIFAAFFVMEIMKNLAVHPVQYGLVGLALALFFLLTLSLSEHMPFHTAYWTAAGASIALLGYYVAHVLGGWRRGLGFSSLLAGLFGLLFGILRSEDAALLMGSIALFGLLGTVMVLTRNIDWYSVATVASRRAG